MAIPAELFERLKKRLDLSERRVYQIIKERSEELYISREQAALALAIESGINVSKFARDGDLDTIRHAAATVRGTPPPAAPVKVASNSPTAQPRRAKKASRARSSAKKPPGGKKVFVVHGRDEARRKAIFSFLRSLGLSPIEWQHALKATGKASPYIGEVLDQAFRDAAAVVVLITPDDEAKLKDEFLKKTDGPEERDLTGQPRPNVLFEAGMAFGHQPNSTVLVQVGAVRPFSDVVGRHVVHLGNDAKSRIELANKLETAGCQVDRTGTDWLTEGDFSD